MKIDQLNERQIEDVEPIEEINEVPTVQEESTEPELTEEQKKQQHDFFVSGFVHKNKYIFSEISNRIVSTGKTLQDLYDEVIEKKSPFTRSQRDFLKMWKLDFLQECLDLFNKQYGRYNAIQFKRNMFASK